MNAYRAAIYTTGIILAIAMSYGFALLGEPQSLWVWRDMIGVISK